MSPRVKRPPRKTGRESDVTGSEYPHVLEIVTGIEAGEYDTTLKGIVDAVLTRKRFLEAQGTFPEQQPVPVVAVAEKVGLAASPKSAIVETEPEKTQDGAPKHKRTIRRTHKPYTRPALKPDDKTLIKPLAQGDALSLTSSDVFKSSNGYNYRRADLIGRQLDVHYDKSSRTIYAPHHSLTHGECVGFRVEVIGVGPKAIQALCVTEPPDLVLMGRNLRDAWTKTEFVFLPHYLAHTILVVPRPGDESLYNY